MIGDPAGRGPPLGMLWRGNPVECAAGAAPDRVRRGGRRSQIWSQSGEVHVPRRPAAARQDSQDRRQSAEDEQRDRTGDSCRGGPRGERNSEDT